MTDDNDDWYKDEEYYKNTLSGQLEMFVYYKDEIIKCFKNGVKNTLNKIKTFIYYKH